MISKRDLEGLVEEALKALNGSAHHVLVAKYIWNKYEQEIRMSGNLLYTWQYDTRWAAQRLRDKGIMKPDDETPKGIWALNQVGALR